MQKGLINILFSITALSASFSALSATQLVSTQKLDWKTAEQLASQAVQNCLDEGYEVTATVVEPSGQQQAVIRSNNAPLQTLSVSYRKAYTAFSYGRTFHKNTTSELVDAKLAGPQEGAVLATEPEIIFIAGGAKIRKADGTVLGGLGVSGAPGGDKDEKCATTALEKFKDKFE
ncbi:GlcG/HbpS family heme-binding protein [Rouxiella chamberiensis]|uniref:Heme-binding protein n=1 Tax=Rouxiella chamberiensis TaxID=1513468 RepID=A0ABY7HSR7_9GAMM|nr:heme-binding protein [Rouxiella chamberiensis]WAT02443.1 heme-binding protein [Rouxiella chamberiensis]